MPKHPSNLLIDQLPDTAKVIFAALTNSIMNHPDAALFTQEDILAALETAVAVTRLAMDDSENLQ